MLVEAENPDGSACPPTDARLANALGPVLVPSDGELVIVRAPPIDVRLANDEPRLARFWLLLRSSCVRATC